MSNQQLLGRIFRLTRPFRHLFLAAALLSLVLAVLGPARPYLIQQSIDHYILQGDYDGLLYMMGFLFALLLIEAVCQYVFILSTNRLGQSVIKDLRVQVFRHVLHFRLRYFDNTPIGTSTTRTINDVESINDIFAEGIINIIADLLTILVVLSIMFYSDWQLALVSLIPFPFLIYATYYFKEGVNATAQAVRTSAAQMNAFLQERISGMGIVQAFGAEKIQFEQFAAINLSRRKANIDEIWYYSVFFPVVEIIGAGAQGLLVWWGASMVVAHQTTPGMLVAFIMYFSLLFRPARMLADKFNTMQMGLVAAERVFALLDRDEQTPNTGTQKIPIKGNISFQNVFFSYNDKDNVLRNVSFDLHAGQTLALVGATGAGKSSVINILNRFYDIQKGKVFIDQTNIKDFDLFFLRKNIGLVLQDVFLFGGTIYENIVLRDTNIPKSRVIEAAKMAGAHDFIMQLPDGYDCIVRERGATLSVGQRQLISFIRALVFDPKILILDEATSSIDTGTEQLIQNAIDNLVKNRTAIIIAHRLSTIQHADKIIVLDKGQIVEQGTHQELLQKEGHYKRLHDEQFLKTDKVAI